MLLKLSRRLTTVQNGINSVSYSQLVWQKFHKEKIQNWVKHEHEWIEFCMIYAEEENVNDLLRKGYN
jgi:hypothetical protein